MLKKAKCLHQNYLNPKFKVVFYGTILSLSQHSRYKSVYEKWRFKNIKWNICGNNRECSTLIFSLLETGRTLDVDQFTVRWLNGGLAETVYGSTDGPHLGEYNLVLKPFTCLFGYRMELLV